MVEHIRIPKRIGAVKLPKKIRRKAKKAFKVAANPFVRDFAGAAMAAAQRVRRDAEDIKDQVKREGEDFKVRFRKEAEAFRERAKEWKESGMCDEKINLKGSKVAEAFRDAAIAGIRTFMDGLEEGLRKAKAEAEAAGDGPAAAKPAKARAKVRVKVKTAQPKAAAKPKPKAKKPRASRSSAGAPAE